METLTLNDGTVLLNSSVYQDELRLYIYVRDNSNMQEVFNLLIVPEKTAIFSSFKKIKIYCKNACKN